MSTDKAHLSTYVSQETEEWVTLIAAMRNMTVSKVIEQLAVEEIAQLKLRE